MIHPLPKFSSRPASFGRPENIQSVADYELHAQARLEPAVWRHLSEGSGNELTLHANARAFEHVRILPRPLANVRGGHTRVKLFGQEFAHPIVLAPIAYQKLFHAEGECATAMAADAQDALMVVSSLASQTLEEIVQAAGRPMWFQLYWQGERERTLRLVQRALATGYSVVVMTVDAPVKQVTIQLPADVSAVNLEAPLSLPQLTQGQSQVFDGWMAQSPTWEDLAWLRAQIKVPLLLKGVLHSADAARAITLGCDGLVVSNHGGRVLDGAPASLDALPAIMEIVAGRVPVLLDSGIRSSSDVFKALAQGVSAVMIGRPYIWGLATAGALGVAHVVRLMRDELEMTMALAGCTNLEDIRRTVKF